MPYSSRTKITGSLGEPRRSFGHMSFTADERTHNVMSRPHQDANPITEPTVLIADDDDDTRVMFRTLLGTKGYRVVEASDGEEVIEVTLRENPGLVLLDLGLPLMNGLNVIRRLRNELQVIDIPVVVITGYDKHFDTAVAAGCDDYLIKPIDFGRLDRKSTRLNSSHVAISYAVFCLKKKTKT